MTSRFEVARVAQSDCVDKYFVYFCNNHILNKLRLVFEAILVAIALW